MVIFNNNLLAGAAAQSTTTPVHTIDQSIRFNALDNPYMSKAFSSKGSPKKFTLSWWTKLGERTTSATSESQMFFIAYHSGGYQTVTTKERMNRFTPFAVTQKNFIWYVDGLPFKDGITFYNDGRIEGVGVDPKETSKLIKKVKQYAINYANAFANGEVLKPNNGDCWGCLFHSEGKTVIAKEHILHHIEDQYYVPSMLARMFNSGTMCLYVKDVICLIWNKKVIFNNYDLANPDMVKNQIAKSIEKFCMRELGLAS